MSLYQFKIKKKKKNVLREFVSLQSFQNYSFKVHEKKREVLQINAAKKDKYKLW